MKTILVPTEDNSAMQSALDTALLVARRCDSYIEGFALRWSTADFAAFDPTGGTNSHEPLQHKWTRSSGGWHSAFCVGCPACRESGAFL